MSPVMAIVALALERKAAQPWADEHKVAKT